MPIVTVGVDNVAFWLYDRGWVSYYVNAGALKEWQLALWVAVPVSVTFLLSLILTVYVELMAKIYAKKWDEFLLWVDKVNKFISQQASNRKTWEGVWIGRKFLYALTNIIITNKKQKVKEKEKESVDDDVSIW